MLSIEINKSQLSRLKGACLSASKSLTKELAGAINQVAKKTRLEMGRDIRAVVAMKKEDSEKPLSVRAEATATTLSAVVSLKKTDRLGLNHFGVRQDKRGVSYKISKTGGRGRVEGGFRGPNPGTLAPRLHGHAFKRSGKKRLPIVQIKGVSAYGAFVKNNLTAPRTAAVQDELHKQMERRINLNVLRANGLVKT